jgi:hypothetical protein
MKIIKILCAVLLSLILGGTLYQCGVDGLTCVFILIGVQLFSIFSFEKDAHGILSMRVNWSGIGASGGSGKIGSSVAAKGRGASYFRLKTKPHNPNSSNQSTSRTNMRINAQAWKALTQTQINSWNAAAPNFPRRNKLGNLIIISGFNLFCGCNNTLRAIGATVITTAPTPTTVLTPLGVAVTYAATVITVTWTSGAIPASTSYMLWATPGLSAGKSYVKSQYRFIEAIAAAATSPQVVTTAYAARFGQAAVGSKVFVYLKSVGTLTGLTAKSAVTSVIVS